MAILDNKTGQPISPETPVKVMDLSGEVKTLPASSAQRLLDNPETGTSIATPEQIQAHKDYVTYTSPTSKVKAAAEAALGSFTAGIAPALIDRVMEDIDPDQAREYRANRQAREEWNPGAGGVGSIAGFVVPGGVASLAEKAVVGVAGKTAAKGLVKVAADTAKGFATGSIYGATSEIVPRLIDSHPLTADAIIDSTWRDGLGFAVPHFILSGAGQALEGVNVIKNKALDNFKKGVSSIDGTPPPSGSAGSTQSITPSELPKENTPFDKKGVILDTKDMPANEVSGPSSDHVNVSGQNRVKISGENLKGNGISFDSQSGLKDIGDANGIEDLAAKSRVLKRPGETAKEFLIRQKIEQGQRDLLSINKDILTPEQKVALYTYDSTLNNYKLFPDDPINIKDMRDSSAKINELFKDVSPEIKDGKIDEKAIHKGVSDYLNKFDHIREDGKTYVFATDSIKGELTQEIGEKINPEMNKVLKDLNVKESAKNKAGEKAINTASDYAQSLYPKEGELEQGQHLIDFINEKNNGNMAQAGTAVGNVVNKAINTLEGSGLGTSITHEDMAKFIDKLAHEKYGDTISGNAHPGSSDSFNTLKQYAKELRDSGFSEKNKYGDPIYKPLSFAELRDFRLKTDDLAFKGHADPAMSQAAARLRDFIELHVMDTLGKNSPSLQSAYAKAKLDYHTAKTMQVLLDGASQKSIKFHTEGDKGAMSTYIALKLARKVFGPAGEVLALGIKAGKMAGIFSSSSEGMSHYFANELTEVVKKYNSSITKAAGGMLSKNPVTYPEVQKQSTKVSINKDKVTLQETSEKQPGYLNDFIGRNEATFKASPNSMNGFMESTIKKNEFLLSKIPQNPYENTPWKKGLWSPSPIELAKYDRYKIAAQNPSEIIKQFNNGYVTPEAIEVLDSIYPSTKNALSTAVLEKIQLGKEFPLEKRSELFKVFGLPLDDWQKPQLFASMQQRANLGVQQTQQEQNNVVNPKNITENQLGQTIGSRTQRTET